MLKVRDAFCGPLYCVLGYVGVPSVTTAAVIPQVPSRAALKSGAVKTASISTATHRQVRVVLYIHPTAQYQVLPEPAHPESKVRGHRALFSERGSCGAILFCVVLHTGELKTPQPDDTVFDIISEDEVSGVHDDSLYTTALSTDTGQL